MIIVREILKGYYDCDAITQLDIDAAISVLSESAVLSIDEQIIINLIKEQRPTIEISEQLGVSERTIYRRLNEACIKLAEYLGPLYQDSKLIKTVQNRLGRELTPDEEKVCWHIINTYGNRRFGDISIFNFKITEDGKIERGEDKE